MSTSKARNIIYLVYSQGSGPRVVLSEHQPAGVGLNLEKGEWTFKNMTYRIGEQSRCFLSRSPQLGIIGVYDQTNVHHVAKMVFDTQEAVKVRTH